MGFFFSWVKRATVLGIIYRISNQYQERNNNFLWKQIISLGRIWCFLTINSFLRQNLILTTQNILFLLKIIISGPWIMLSRAKIFCQNSAKIIKNLNLEKGAPKLCWAAMTKPRQIECTVFFTGPQRTNLNLLTGLRSNKGSVPEKSLNLLFFVFFGGTHKISLPLGIIICHISNWMIVLSYLVVA